MAAQTLEAGVEERLRDYLQKISSYMETYHGGAVEMVGYEDGQLRVRLSGACTGCDLTEATLHGWIEGNLRPFFPEVTSVESV